MTATPIEPEQAIVLTASSGVRDDLVALVADGRAWTRLGPGAAEFAADGDGPPAHALAQARARAADAPVDVNLAATSPRRKSFLFADMDGTVIGCECIDEIAAAAGVGDRVAAVTEKAMRGEIGFEGALAERVALLAGASADLLEQVWAEKVRLTPGAEILARTMRGWGARCEILSGGFTFFTERVAEAAGFQRHGANTLEIENGVLTGRVVPPVMGPDAKLTAVRRALAQAGAQPNAALAVGDGANDAPMLLEAGLGVGYRPKPAAADAADAVLAHSDLTAVLSLQGVRHDEFSSEAARGRDN